MNDNSVPPSESSSRRVPWNKGKLAGAKPPLRPRHVWSIRTKLQLERRTRDLAIDRGPGRWTSARGTYRDRRSCFYRQGVRRGKCHPFGVYGAGLIGSPPARFSRNTSVSARVGAASRVVEHEQEKVAAPTRAEY